MHDSGWRELSLYTSGGHHSADYEVKFLKFKKQNSSQTEFTIYTSVMNNASEFGFAEAAGDFFLFPINSLI